MGKEVERKNLHTHVGILSFHKTAAVIEHIESGHTALSTDERHLLVDNLYDGVDIYTFPDFVLQNKLLESPKQGFTIIKQVAFVQGGTLVAHGTERGVIRVAKLDNPAESFELYHCYGKAKCSLQRCSHIS